MFLIAKLIKKKPSPDTINNIINRGLHYAVFYNFNNYKIHIYRVNMNFIRT